MKNFAQIAYMVWLGYGIIVMLICAVRGEMKLRKRIQWTEKLHFDADNYWYHMTYSIFALTEDVEHMLKKIKWCKRHPKTSNVIIYFINLATGLIDLTTWPVSVYRILASQDAMDRHLTQMVCTYE